MFCVLQCFIGFITQGKLKVNLVDLKKRQHKIKLTFITDQIQIILLFAFLLTCVWPQQSSSNYSPHFSRFFNSCPSTFDHSPVAPDNTAAGRLPRHWPTDPSIPQPDGFHSFIWGSARQQKSNLSLLSLSLHLVFCHRLIEMLHPPPLLP